MKPEVAIIVVDVQNDFLPGGALAVTDGDKVIPVINKLIEMLGPRALVITTQDWHPENTSHFDKWPVHCVAYSKGAAFPDAFSIHPGYIQLKKGMGIDEDAYSAFDAQLPNCPDKLDDILNGYGIKTLYVVGLATDYCVKATVLDALKRGYNTVVVANAVAGVAPESTEQAWTDMTAAGAVKLVQY